MPNCLSRYAIQTRDYAEDSAGKLTAGHRSSRLRWLASRCFRRFLAPARRARRNAKARQRNFGRLKCWRGRWLNHGSLPTLMQLPASARVRARHRAPAECSSHDRRLRGPGHSMHRLRDHDWQRQRTVCDGGHDRIGAGPPPRTGANGITIRPLPCREQARTAANVRRSVV